MSTDFRVIVMGERAVDFEAVFGSATVCVQSPTAQLADIEGEMKRVYLLDLDTLTDEQKDRLVQHLARKSGCSESIVSAGLEAVGLPIVAEETILTIEKLLRWLDLSDEPEPFGLFDDVDDEHDGYWEETDYIDPADSLIDDTF